MTKRITTIMVPRDATVPVNDIPAPEWEQVRRQANARPVISADWFSNLNDAVAAAGNGGTILLSRDTNYYAPEPIRLMSGQAIEGEDRFTSRVEFDGEAAIAGPGDDILSHALIRNFTISGTVTGGDRWQGGIGLDARGFVRCHIDMMNIEECATNSVWWGGDIVGGGYSNTMYRSRVSWAANGNAAMKFAGRSGGAGGAYNANFNHIMSCTIMSVDSWSPDSPAIHLIEGERNIIEACDIGYGVGSSPAILIEEDAKWNRFMNNRTENVKVAVRIRGGERNMFTNNAFHIYPNTEFHPVEIDWGTRNAFLHNHYVRGLQPYVYEITPSSTIIDDIDHMSTIRDTVRYEGANASPAFEAKRVDEAFPRHRVDNSGYTTWLHPDNAAILGRLGPRSTTYANTTLEWSDGAYVALPNFPGLPTAEASRRGCVIRVAGGTGVKDGVYVCVKTAGDTYIWHQLY